MRSLRASAVAVATTAALLLTGLVATPAAALASPGPVGPGGLYAEDFAAIGDWTAVSGSATPWTVAGGIVSADTTTASSGSYIRPTAVLTLPAAYELRTHVKVDSIASDGAVALLLDMTDATSLRASGMSAQFTPLVAGRAGVRVAKPIVSTVVCSGKTPLVAEGWAALTVRRANGITAIYVDGELVSSVASPAEGGTLGLGAYHAKTSFGPISVDALNQTPAGHPTSAGGCKWEPTGPVTPTPTPTPTTTPTPSATPTPTPTPTRTPPAVPATVPTVLKTVNGGGTWIPAAAASSDRPGHEVTAGEATISLDGEWSFSTDPGKTGVANQWPQPSTNTAAWEKRTVPGNWDISDKYARYEGAAWYKRTFEIGDVNAARNERVRVAFGAVYENTDVWINGTFVGNHRGGYTPFEFDISSLLIDGQNTIVVRADNSFQQGAWWSWGGISRSVELIKSDTIVIDRQQIVATPDLVAKTAKVTSTVFLENTGAAPQDVTVRGTIRDAATGAVLVDGLQAQVTVPAVGRASAALSADLAAGTFRLWNLDDPSLYRFDVAIDVAAGHTDGAVSDRFGIRLFEINGAKVTLNGEQLRLAGANRVSDDAVHGNVEPIDVVRRDMDRMKASGLDLTRIMHYAQAPELLDYADEIGMLLIDEVPVWQQGRSLALKDIAPIKEEFRVMVERDFNHPSIFAHSVANEIDSHYDEGRKYDQEMALFSKEIDPTRFVTQATDTMNEARTTKDNDGSQYMDFVSINTYSSSTFAALATKPLTFWGKPVFVSEYSPDGYEFGIERESKDFSTGSGSFGRVFANLPHVFGWSQWTYNDYRSDFKGSSGNLVRGWGNQDVWGRLKAGFATTQAANAPISSISLDEVASDASRGLGTVTITPRASTNPSGPLRELHDHRLVLRAAGADGAVVGGSVVDLPVIAPGSAKLRIPVKWTGSGQATRVTASLLSPAGYEVAVAVSDVAVPKAPVITQTVVADGAVRVRFDDAAKVGVYEVVASTGVEGEVDVKVTTTESFADLTGLKNGTAYKVTVAAVGTSGTGPSAQVTLQPKSGETLPPKVVALTPVVGGLVLGYSDLTPAGKFEDYLYVEDSAVTFTVRVDDVLTGKKVQEYSTKTRPGTRIEGLTPGRSYKVQIKNDTPSKVSAWSEFLTGVPLAADTAPVLDVKGTIAGANSAGVVVTPTAGTVRYRVTVDGPGVRRSYDVERAAVDVLPIHGLAPASAYRVTVAAVGVSSTSQVWTGELTTQSTPSTGTPGVPTGLTYTNVANDAFLRWNAQEADGFVVERFACDVTTTRMVLRAEASIGKIGAEPGVYRVRAVANGEQSDWSTTVTVPGTPFCTAVVVPGDTSPREDGSIPFASKLSPTSTSKWQASGLVGAGGYASVYAELNINPNATATWTAPTLTGKYTVRASIPSNPNSSKQAVFTLTGAGEAVVTKTNQVAAGNTWVDLGEITVDATHRATVTLSGTDAGVLRASAVEFTPVPDPTVFPTAPKPTAADQVIEEGGEIVGAGTAAGNAITVSLADGTVIGEASVGSDGRWTVRGALPPGATVVTVLERDTSGWTGTASATVTLRVDDEGEPGDGGPGTGEPGDGGSGESAAWAVVDVGSGRVAQGGVLEVRVSGLTPGQKIAATVHSEPYAVAGIPAADAAGRIAFPISIPADFATGAHTLVIESAGLAALSTLITVTADGKTAASGAPSATGALSATGGTFPIGFVTVLAVGLLVMGLVLLIRRRRFTQ